MTLDLFAAEPALQPLGMADADVSFLRHLPLPCPADELLEALIAQTPWRADSVVVWGRTHLQPRLTAWFGDLGARYAYSGLLLDPSPWTPLLADLRERVQDRAQAPFNSVLLNLYRDHRDRMGLHSDDEPELGPEPVIASLSLGATRTLVFRHRHRAELKPVRCALPSGSLLLMQGGTQRHWKHGIDAQATPCGPRVNLTFRHIRAGAVSMAAPCPA